MTTTGRAQNWTRLALWLVGGTMIYNGIEAVIALWSGLAAHSIALLGFGLDSVIELAAATALLWRLRVEARGGGGRGLLSIELRELGFAPTIIDPRLATNMPHRVRKALRREALRTGKVPRLPRLHARVEEVDLSEFDLIAGLHPDQATEPIVRQAVKAEKSFAVVPCCMMPLDGTGRSYDEWVAYLAGLAPGSWRVELPIEGARIVICRRGLPVLPSNPVRASSAHHFLGHLESGGQAETSFREDGL